MTEPPSATQAEWRWAEQARQTSTQPRESADHTSATTTQPPADEASVTSAQPPVDDASETTAQAPADEASEVTTQSREAIDQASRTSTQPREPADRARPSAQPRGWTHRPRNEVLVAEWLRPPAKVWGHFVLAQLAIAVFSLLTAWGEWRIALVTTAIAVAVTTTLGLAIMFDQAKRRWWFTGERLFTGFPDSSKLPVNSVPLSDIRSVEAVETRRWATIENAIKSPKVLGCAKVWCERNVVVRLEDSAAEDGPVYLSTDYVEEAADALADAAAAARGEDTWS